jgi:hypothetical protein
MFPSRITNLSLGRIELSGRTGRDSRLAGIGGFLT